MEPLKAWSKYASHNKTIIGSDDGLGPVEPFNQFCVKLFYFYQGIINKMKSKW